MAKELIIDIDEDGNVSIDAVGFSGDACEKATEKLIEALGKIKEMKKKPEFRHKTRARVSQN